MPMRDASGENIGLVVYAFKNPANPSTSATEKEYFDKARLCATAWPSAFRPNKALFDPASRCIPRASERQIQNAVSLIQIGT